MVRGLQLAAVATADAFSERTFGASAFTAFQPSASGHRAAAAAIRARFEAIGFGATEAAALFGLTEIADVRPSRSAYYDDMLLPRNAAGAAARFFVLHQPQTNAELEGWLGRPALDFLTGMGAIVTVDGRRRALASATWLAGQLIFADARAYNAIWPGEPFADYVMPPGGDTVGLVRVAPRAPRRSTLDVCCGSGAQALAAAAYSERVTGVDVNPRALRFARFNAAVNGIKRATFELGDTYAPLGDASYDAIVANPPFVPWPPDEDALRYRGGGAHGDDVLGRIIAGAVERLDAPGSLALVADLANVDTLDERIAAWQGERRRTLVLLAHRYDLIGYAEAHAAHLDASSDRQAQTVRHMRHFEHAGIRTLDFGYIVQDGTPGTTHVERSAAMLDGPVHETVSAWFARPTS